MKAYKSRLAALMRIRALREELARAALLAANKRSQSAALEHSERQNNLASGDFIGSGPVSAAELLASFERSRLAAQAVSWAARTSEQARQIEESARIEWSKAAADQKALQRYEERRVREHHELYLKEQARLQDESASIMNTRRAKADATR